VTVRIGFLGLGEAGSEIAADLAQLGLEVRGWDPLVPSSPGVETLDGPGAVGEGARVVVSVNSALDALDAAASVALRPGQLFADLNTAAPARKREVAALISPSGAAFADVALVRSVPGRGVRPPALVSGEGAAAVAELFGGWGMPVSVVGEEPGLAAGRKLVRSVFVKGLTTAALEALAAARRIGCEPWLREDLARTLEAADGEWLQRLVRPQHAARRTEEMEAAAAMLAELGVEPRIARAAEAWLRELA
jgi:3-hydroxyisobutyrate dehydrogenase-like beta-hydroxyacid dehydrogenase